MLDDSLTKVIDSAREKNFYRRVLSQGGFELDGNIDEETFKHFPIISKDDLNRFANEMKESKELKVNRTGTKRVRTSGSTGKFTEIYWYLDEYNQSNIEIWRMRNKWYGIKPSSKCVSFNSMMYLGNRIEKPEKIKYYTRAMLGFSKYWLEDSDFILYSQEMEKFRPEWMLIQPSTCLRMLEAFDSNEITLCDSIRYIELAGETLTQEMEEYIRDKTKVNVANMYGANEVGSIAYECPEHKMHILEDNVFLETVLNEGREEAVVTGKKNTLMPVIRYNLQDVITINKKMHCSCGLCSDIVEKVSGRVSKDIVIRGKRLSPYIFIYVVESVNDMLNHPILQYQTIVNRNRGSITLDITIKQQFYNWGETIRNELCKKMKESINSNEILVEVNVTEKVMTGGEKKFQMFIVKEGMDNE